MKSNLPLLFLIGILSVEVYAQEAYEITPSGSKMSVIGTSTLHDWESNVNDYSGSAQLKDNFILDIEFTAKVESMKSGKSGMDKNMYSALKSEKFPEITFSAKKLAIEGSNAIGSGKLTIAGKTNAIEVELNYEKWNEDSFQVMGNVILNMTDYEVDPPKAMMGAIKAGEEVTISFELNLQK